jgi:uncharacterized protein (TIGR03437 family)
MQKPARSIRRALFLFLLAVAGLCAQPSNPFVVVSVNASKSTLSVSEPFELVAQVTDFPNPIPTGVVQFFLEESGVMFPLGQTPVDGQGVGRITTQLSQIGTARIGCFFTALDSNGQPTGRTGQGNAVFVEVQPRFRYLLTLSAAPLEALPGDKIRLTAGVTALDAGPANPPGVISFFRGSELLGTVDLAGGNWAWIELTTLPAGVNPISAEFVGAPLAEYGTATASTTVAIGVDSLFPTLPSSITFVQQIGDPAPDTQSVSLSTAAGLLDFVVTALDGPWLKVSPSATTPAQIVLGVEPLGLQPGVYSARLRIDLGAVGSRWIRVNYILAPSPSLIAVPQRLRFEYTQFGVEPPSQPLFLTSTSRNGEVRLSTTASFVEIVRPSGLLPGNFQIRVKPANLVPGTYTGTIAVGGALYNAIEVPVELVVSRARQPIISLSGLVNGARQQQLPMAPNTMMSLYGLNLGQPGITKVYVAGRQVPVNAVSPGQVNFTIPAFLNGYPSADVEVEVLGQKSQPIALGVRATSPGIFTASGTGSGQAAAINQDGRSNSTTRPARPGSALSFFVTGFGLPGPRDSDGLQRLVLPVFVRIGGVTARVEFAGPTPSLGEAVQQVNVRLPDSVPTGPTVPVVMNVGGVDTQPGVTVSIQR